MIKSIYQTLRRVLLHLPRWAKTFLGWYSFWTALLALVDIAALMLLALTMGSAASGGTMRLPGIGSIPPELLPWLVVIVVVVVIVKSALNLLLQWRATRRFAELEKELAASLFHSYIRADWHSRLRQNTASILQVSDTGLTNTIAGFLLPLSTIPAALATCLGTLVLISVAQPVTALASLLYLGVIAVVQYLVLMPKTRQAARVVRNGALRMSTLVSGMVGAIKEITLRDKGDEAEAVVAATRADVARARSNASFLAVVPRFVLDAALMGGFLVVGAVAFLTSSETDRMASALVAVAMFGVAGLRMVPSLTGLQATITRAATALPYVERVLTDIEARPSLVDGDEPRGELSIADPERLVLSGIDFHYPDSAEPALRGVELDIPLGSRIGIAGASGAGKSTLVDILLGLLEPSAGSIRLDDTDLRDVMADWRGRVGYVPQDVAIFEGTFAQNIALTWTDDIDYERVERAARRAQLWDLVSTRSEGLRSSVGERGVGMSGGQRQRLGIARALYTDPLVLVLDEATSALDSRTESVVLDALEVLEGEVTVIAIAHRLATIRDTDMIVFMKDGTIRARGTFDEVVVADEEFRQQAKLAGLA